MAQFLLWPLRQAAIIPVFGLGFGALGAFYGAYDLSYKAIHLITPRTYKSSNVPKAAQTFGFFCGLASGAAFGVARELFFLPPVPPAPKLPIDNVSWPHKIKNGILMAKHTLRHYPYRFRAVSVICAGAISGVSHVISQAIFAKKEQTEIKDAVPSPQAHGGGVDLTKLSQNSADTTSGADQDNNKNSTKLPTNTVEEASSFANAQARALAATKTPESEPDETAEMLKAYFEGDEPIDHNGRM